jgi:pyridoxamine 5'-phosphate oxidase
VSFSHPDRTLHADELSPDPIDQFRRWYDDAEAEDVPMANAMALATADAGGRPSVRHVLLRGFDDRGFVFYTNHGSRKGRELAVNPSAALVWLWKELDRQVTVTGTVERATEEESDAYFVSRPKEAQIGAWASRQSEVIDDRRVLDEAVAAFDRRFAEGPVPRPPHWGGYRLTPGEVEFWQGRSFRLHDRFRYARAPEGGWRIDRLSP